MRLFGEIGGAYKGPEVNSSGRSCQYVSKNVLNAWRLLLCDGFCVCSNVFCTLRHIARQRVYDINDAIIYSKRPLLSLRPLPSNNELIAVKAHYVSTIMYSLYNINVSCEF